MKKLYNVLVHALSVIPDAVIALQLIAYELSQIRMFTYDMYLQYTQSKQ